jgi:hypothetical protein
MRSAVAARFLRSALPRWVSSSGSSTFSRRGEHRDQVEDWKTKPIVCDRHSASSSSLIVDLGAGDVDVPPVGRSRPAMS